MSIIATLAVAIAMATVVFAVVHGMLLAPPRYASPESIIAIEARSPSGGEIPLSVAEFIDLRTSLVPRVFSKLTLFRKVEGNLTGTDRPDRITSQGVTGDFFPLLGVQPEIGRTFTPAEELPGVAPSVVISDALWRRRFGGSPNALGRRLRLDDDEYTIVGVMPPAFQHPGATRANPVDLWFLAGFRGTPFGPPNRRARDLGNRVLARLAPGVTIDAAAREVAALTNRWPTEYAADYPAGRAPRFSVAAVRDEFTSTGLRQGLVGLLVGVAFLLLVASANVAGLQLVRGMQRQGEIAVRLALGASRARLVGQLLGESLVIGALASIAGVILASFAMAVVKTRLLAALPFADAVGVNAPVLFWSIIGAVGITALFGVLPAMVSTRIEPSVVLRTERGGGSARSALARRSLVVFEVSAAVMLLVGGVQLGWAFLQLQRTNPGLDRSNLLTFQLSVPYPNDPLLGKYVANTARSNYYSRLLEDIARTPGVRSVALTGVLPFAAGPRARTPVGTDADVSATNTDLRMAEFSIVSPGYFQTLGVPLLRGRDLSGNDSVHADNVAVINHATSQMLWPGQSPIDKRLRIGPPSGGQWFTVVGEVGDFQTHSLNEAPLPQVYLSYRQGAPFTIGMVVRTAGVPEAVAPAIADVVRKVEPDQPIYSIHSLTDLMAADLEARRNAATAVMVFGVLGLILAGVGIYGFIAFVVATRMREFGIRIALGMTPGALTIDVIRQSLGLGLTGLLVGGVASLMLLRVIGSRVLPVPMPGVTTLSITALLVCVVVIGATWLPARRAAASDPLSALRSA